MARFESYRGFLFGSLNPDVLPLREHLGEAAKIIDMIVDQSPEGLEVLRGSSTYVYDGNWKLQTENGADGYHVSAVHWNYAATTSRRKEAEQVDTTRAMSAGGWAKQGGGFYSFENGHLLLWTNWANPEDRPNWERREELAAQFGQARADWMVQRSRNLCLYPNVYLMDQFSSQIRTYRPIAVDKTEVTIYCIAPKGESAEARARRIRQYEDFFNASGMATPDDLEEFRACQMAYDGPRRALERHVPRRQALDRGPRRGGRSDRPEAADERREDRGRRPVRRPAQVLAGGRCSARSPPKPRSPEGKRDHVHHARHALAATAAPLSLEDGRRSSSTARPAPWTTRTGTAGSPLRAGRRVLDAGLGRRRQADRGPADARSR